MPFNADDFKDDQAFADYIKTITSSLTATNDGLKADLVKLKGKVKEFEGVDLEELKKAKTDLEALQSQQREGETELQKAMRIASETHKQSLADMEKKLNLLTNRNRTLLVDDSLRMELTKANCKPLLISAAISLLKPNVSVIEEDGLEKAVVGDKTIAQYVEEWAKTDVGSNFVLAKQNTGGGVIGVNQQSINENGKFFDKKSPSYNLTEQLKIKKANPDLYSKLAEMFK
jgi:hypothetical protein